MSVRIWILGQLYFSLLHVLIIFLILHTNYQTLLSEEVQSNANNLELNVKFLSLGSACSSHTWKILLAIFLCSSCLPAMSWGCFSSPHFSSYLSSYLLFFCSSLLMPHLELSLKRYLFFSPHCHFSWSFSFTLLFWHSHHSYFHSNHHTFIFNALSSSIKAPYEWKQHINATLVPASKIIIPSTQITGNHFMFKKRKLYSGMW